MTHSVMRSEGADGDRTAEGAGEAGTEATQTTGITMGAWTKGAATGWADRADTADMAGTTTHHHQTKTHRHLAHHRRSGTKCSWPHTRKSETGHPSSVTLCAVSDPSPKDEPTCAFQHRSLRRTRETSCPTLGRFGSGSSRSAIGC